MEIPRECYKLAELAQKKWVLNEDEILHIASVGELRLSVYWGGNYWTEDDSIVPNHPPLNQYVYVPQQCAHKILNGIYTDINGGVEISDVVTTDGQNVILVRKPSPKLDEDYDKIVDLEHTLFSPIISKDKIVILAVEVKRYEALHPEILKSDKESDNKPTDNTLLKFIGALIEIHYLNKKPETYKKSSGPNVNAIATQFYRNLADASIDDDGIKDSTVRKNILPAAIESIQPNKKLSSQ